MSLLAIGIQTPVLTVAGTPNQILVNGQYAAVNGNIVIALDGAVASGVSGFNAVIAATGQALVGLVYGGDTNLSGALVSMSGQLVTQIQSAAGVLSLNSLTGLLTLAGTNGVTVSTSGTTLWVSGTSGFNAATYATIANQIGGDTNLSGSLLSVSGALQALITGAASDVNSINGVTGDVTLSAPATFNNYLGILTAGQTISITGAPYPRLSGVTFSNGTQIVGVGGSVQANPTANFPINLTDGVNIAALPAGVGIGTNGAGGNGSLVLWSRNSATAGIIFAGNNSEYARIMPDVGLVMQSGILFRDTGNYTASGATSVAQLTSASGGLIAAIGAGVAPNVVYITGNQTINGVKTFQSGLLTSAGIGGVTALQTALQVGITSATTAVAPLFTTGSAIYLGIGGGEFATGSYRLIGFGQRAPTSVTYPAFIGYQEISQASQTFGDLVFGTRSVASDTAPSERMRITSAGNVGISTISPSGRLHIATTSGTASRALTLQTTDAAIANSVIQWMDSAGMVETRIGSNINVAEMGALEFVGPAGTSSMVIRSGGNVGIGINTPQERLHVFGGNLRVDGSGYCSGTFLSRSYQASVSGSPIPVAAAGTGFYNVNFTSDAGLLTTTITGLTIFSGVNYTAGGAATVRINVSGANSVLVSFPNAWNWVSAIPTGLATGRFAILTLNTFTANDSGVCAAFAVAP